MANKAVIKMSSAVEAAQKEMGRELDLSINGDGTFTVTEKGENLGLRFQEPPEDVGVGELTNCIVQNLQEGAKQALGIDGDPAEAIGDALKESRVVPYLAAPSFMEKGAVRYDIIPGHLALGLKAVISDNEYGRATVVVTEQMLDHYGVEAPYPFALLRGYHESVMALGEVVGGMLHADPDLVQEAEAAGEAISEVTGLQNPLVIITTVENGGAYGACIALKPGVLKKAGEKMGADIFYLLPSSQGEFITSPITEDPSYLKGMVEYVNEGLKPSQIMSDEVFIYDALLDCITVAGKEHDVSLRYYITL